MSVLSSITESIVGALFVGVLLLGSATAAPSYDFGVHVDDEQPDATPWLRPLTTLIFCFVDEDGQGAYSPGESVSLHANGDCTLKSDAIRMTSLEGSAAGRFIRSTEPDGRPDHTSFGATAPVIGYSDIDASGTMTIGDAVYLDVRDPSLLRVQVGDIRLTASSGKPAGTHVGNGDDDVDRTIVKIGDLTSIIGYADIDGNEQFGNRDTLYLRQGTLSGEAVVEIGDVRLGGALPDTFGTFVSLGDADAPAALLAAASALVCFAPGDNGALDPSDTVILRSSGSCSTIRTGDVRLSAASGVGTRVAAGDDDLGEALQGVTGKFTYRDLDGTSGFGVGDLLYLDLTGSPSSIDAADIRLSATATAAGGVSVSAGDDDDGRPTVLLGDLASYVGVADADGSSGISDEDVFYLNADGGGAEPVEAGDVRLGAVNEELFFGGQVTTGSPEAGRALLSRSFEVCVADVTGGDYDLGDYVYLTPSTCGSGLAEHSVRLVAVENHEPGSKVRPGEETGSTLLAPSYDFSYLDADTSSTWSFGDTLYLHIYSGTDSGRVGLGDVRLTPFGDLPGGTAVTSADADENAALIELTTSVSGLVDYWDVDGDGSYTRPDIVYLDPASTIATRPNLGFVRLGTLEAPMAAAPPGDGAIDDDTDPDVSPSPDDSDETGETPEQSLEDGDQDDPSGKGADTPAPSLAFSLALVGVLLLAMHRGRKAS